jgi:hypothetical protein
MTPDSEGNMDQFVRRTTRCKTGARTLLADGGETPFELPVGSADEWEWLEDFDRLGVVHETSRVERGETLDGIGFFDALGKVYDVLVCPCRRESK